MQDGKMAPARPRLRAALAGCTGLAALFAAGAVAAAPATATTPPPYNGPAPVWPRNPEAPAGAPNVLLILTDDVGFGAASAFGGPVPTPVFDALAKGGLRYNQFNTTAMCSPTRASLLTGRAPHNVGIGELTDIATGYPGYNSVIPKSAATIAEVLKLNGYNTAMFGKAHFTPTWEMSQAGPFDRWPTGLGFEYFYGFLDSDTDQVEPVLVENNRAVEPPHDDPTYFLDRDLADRTIGWLNEQHAVAPKKPFFIYYATGAAHAPNQAPREWMAKFKGKFDQGWDKMRADAFVRQKAMGVVPKDTRLTPRPATLPAWDSLSKDQQKVSARFMEAYAASLASADAQIGRIVDHLKATGQFDNTLIIFVQGDNGSTTEGGINGTIRQQSVEADQPETLEQVMAQADTIGTGAAYNTIPAGWGWGLNSPFQWNKQMASHFGGIRNGLVISWPDHIRDTGGVRSQFHHVSDVYPTILEAAGIQQPAVVEGVTQKPLDGVSMAYTFKDAKAPSHRKVQVFGLLQNLGIYQDGWFAGTTPDRASWEILAKKQAPLGERRWELYRISTDFSQSKDLAASDPAKLKEMQALFWQEAERTQMLPINNFQDGLVGRPSYIADQKTFTYLNGVRRVPAAAAAPTIGRSFSIKADIVVPEQGARGVIVAQGGRHQGMSLYLQDGRPVFYYNGVGAYQYAIRADRALPPGRHSLVVDFVRDAATPHAPATVSISADGKPLASGRVERTMVGWVNRTEGLDVGYDSISPVAPDYRVADSAFTGGLSAVVFEIK